MTTINGTDVRRELVLRRLRGDERIAILSGFARSCLALVRRGGAEFELCLDCQAEFIRDYVSQLMCEEFSVMPKSSDKNALVYADCERLLHGLSIVDGDGNFTDGISSGIASPAYVRGVFFGCGSMSAQYGDVRENKSIGYHLEFSLASEDFADAFTRLLGEYGITARNSVRGERYIVYVKDSESVSDCLALIGAEKSVIKLNETIAALAVKRDVNRRVNCEMANMGRTARAAVGIVEAIELIDRRSGLDVLDKKLREAAKARLDAPDAPLSEIAETLGISKSGLKHRFDKIIEIAHTLDNGD